MLDTDPGQRQAAPAVWLNRRRRSDYTNQCKPSWCRDVRRPDSASALLSLRARFRAATSSLVTTLAMLMFVLPAIADAAPEVDVADEIAPTPRNGLLLRMQNGYQIATRINSDIRLAVSGLTTRATLSQSFRNDGDAWVEGIYVFPLPDGAAVDRLRIRIGDRLIEGEIQEKAQAKATYEKARAEGKRASLVRQERANLFTTSVANIGPGETVTIEIEYLDTVRFDDGTFSLRFPLTLTPRYVPGVPLPDRQGSGWSPDTAEVPDASRITPPMVAKSDDHRVSFEAHIDAGMDLEFIASRYHPVKIERSGSAYDLRFRSTDVPMDHDIELLWRPVRDQSPRAMLFQETLDDDPHLLVMLMPPNDESAVVTIPPRDLRFVIDTSGSMHGVSIGQAKLALKVALEGLRPVDVFNVIQFNSMTESLFPDSVPGTPENLLTAERYVQGLEANGGTEMRPALERALAGNSDDHYLRQVVFITDGSVGNEDALFRLIEQRLGETRLFTVGIGSAPNGWFMQKAAEAGRGTFETISALHEVEEKMQRLFRKLEQPMVTDVELEWPSGLTPASYPATVPDLYAGEPVVLKARLEQAPRSGDQLVIRGRLPDGDWGAELPLGEATDAAGIAAVWARAHIADLADEERRDGASDQLRDAIIATALKHRIVSKYTSLVAVDKTPARSAEIALAREQVPNLLPYGQSSEAIFGFPATATIAPSLRRSGALLLGLGSILLLLQVWSVRGGRRDGPSDDERA